MLHQRLENMWWNDRRTPNVILRGLSFIYAWLSMLDQQWRLKHAVKPPVPMISVGSITGGGSDKTAFAAWLATELKQMGFNPVLLSRGDRANNQAPHLMSQYSNAHEVGDEAALLYRLSDCPVVAGRDRMAGAQVAAEFGDILILCDGFQYRQLQRVCDIVLVPSEGVGNGCLLPAGPLREPVSALAQADVIVRSGSGDFTLLSEQKEWVWSVQASCIRDWNSRTDIFLDSSRPVQVVTAIARPGRVIRALQVIGFEVAEHSSFANHHEYSKQDVQLLLESHKPVVTTAKDAVKLLPHWPCDMPLWVLEQQVEAQAGLARSIADVIRSKKRD